MPPSRSITSTFWYHPVEGTPGHLLGFFDMFLLLLQGRLFMTRYHVNRWWTLGLEMMMVVHGTTVAYFAVAGLEGRWSHFLFGGLAVFLITQMHGVPFKRWQKIVVLRASVRKIRQRHIGPRDGIDMFLVETRFFQILHHGPRVFKVR